MNLKDEKFFFNAQRPMPMVFKEQTPIRGRIRRAIRTAQTWCKNDAIVTLAAVALVGSMIIMAQIQMGEYPSGPGANLSPSHRQTLLKYQTAGTEPVAEATGAALSRFAEEAR